jgi:hypothetical protein
MGATSREGQKMDKSPVQDLVQDELDLVFQSTPFFESLGDLAAHKAALAAAEDAS